MTIPAFVPAPAICVEVTCLSRITWRPTFTVRDGPSVRYTACAGTCVERPSSFAARAPAQESAPHEPRKRLVDRVTRSQVQEVGGRPHRSASLSAHPAHDLRDSAAHASVPMSECQKYSSFF